MNAEFLNSDLKDVKKSIYPRKCDKCSKILKTKNTFYKHKKKHCGKIKPVYPRTCEVCNKCYSSARSFNNHKKLCIPSSSGDNISSNIEDCRQNMKFLFTCMYCGVTFARKQSFQNHTASCNGEMPKTYFDCIFPECSKSFARLKILCKHMSVEHGTSGMKDLTFESFVSFQQWLKSEGIATFKFKKGHGRKTSHNVVHYYKCQFYKAHFFKPLGLRRNKKGTIPQNINCPVSIYATEEEGTVRVRYFSKHNHEIRIENYRF